MLENNLAPSRSTRLSLRLFPSDQRCLLCLVIGVSVFSLLKIHSSKELSEHATQPVRFRLDLNSASVEELVLLPGIGEVRAAAIVRYRREMGPFQAVDELRRIKGIGPKTLSGLTGLVYVHHSTEERPEDLVRTTRMSNGTGRQIAALPPKQD